MLSSKVLHGLLMFYAFVNYADRRKFTFKCGNETTKINFPFWMGRILFRIVGDFCRFIGKWQSLQLPYQTCCNMATKINSNIEYNLRARKISVGQVQFYATGLVLLSDCKRWIEYLIPVIGHLYVWIVPMFNERRYWRTRWFVSSLCTSCCHTRSQLDMQRTQGGFTLQAKWTCEGSEF